MFSMEITRLIERCKQGDADALGELYKAYAQRMRSVCRRYISGEQAVEDVLHDAFVIIFTSFDKLRDDSKAEAWMTAITRNVASKYKDYLKAMPTVPLDEANEAALSVGENEERDVRGVPLSEVVGMIGRLPKGYGQVFRLSVFEGMSHKEIAGMLGIEPHSSSSQLTRAKKLMRKMMQQYGVAMLLLLLIPVTFFLFRMGETPAGEEGPVVAKQKDVKRGHRPSPKDSLMEQTEKPVTLHLPVRQTTMNDADTLQPIIALTADSLTSDTLSNTMMAQEEQTAEDTLTTDTGQTVRRAELPHYDVVDLLPKKPTIGSSHQQRWSLELAYAGQFGHQPTSTEPYIYKPYIDPSNQSDATSGEAPTYIVPSSIDNWTDYAIYLANNPNAVSDQNRNIIMRIALSNAGQPGEDKIIRKTHHQLPVTCSLALKYRLSQRWGIETGLGYSRLTSDFEMGENGNRIEGHQTLHYLGIPVKALYQLRGGRSWSLYGGAGMTMDIPLHSRLGSRYYVKDKFEGSDKTRIHAPWQFSATLGLGLQYHITPSIGLFAEPGLQYYIPARGELETYRTAHPFSFSLPLGIRFTW